MRLMERTKAQTKVFALKSRLLTVHDHSDAYTGDGETHTRIDLEHHANLESLLCSMDTLSPELPPAQLRKDEMSWCSLLNRSARSLPRSTSVLSFAASSEPGTRAPLTQPRGARIMVALTDKRRCNLWATFGLTFYHLVNNRI